jgi:hypothetical protein
VRTSRADVGSVVSFSELDVMRIPTDRYAIPQRASAPWAPRPTARHTQGLGISRTGTGLPP